MASGLIASLLGLLHQIGQLGILLMQQELHAKVSDVKDTLTGTMVVKFSCIKNSDI